jgi:cell division protein FtsW (lipid II flippase)
MPTERRPLNLTLLGWGLTVPVLLLSAIGLACIHVTDRSAAAGADGAAAQTSGADEGWLPRVYHAVGPLTTRQIVYMLTGAGLMLLLLRPSYQKLGRYAYPFYGLAVLLLALLVLDGVLDRFHLPGLPFVPVLRNTRRWIDLGPLRFQPSEFMKLALVLALARYLRFRSSYRRWSGLIPPFLLTIVPMFLILFQPDLGTLLMLLPVLFSMLFVAGARLRHLALVVVLGGALMPAFYLWGMKDYQRARIEVLFKQGTQDKSWQMDEGYQLRQSKTALGTGGWTGQGYGEGIFVQYDGLLPEEHNDFIFAIIGHQWGLVGGLLVIVAYSVIVLLGLEVATVTNDPFGRLLAIGVVVMIVAQALLNICMTIGLAPITGMPLPFVSAGGSSLWANFLALGLLVNVAQRRPLLIAHAPFEYGDEE